MRYAFASLCIAFLTPTLVLAQSQVAAEPIVGLRDNPGDGFAFVHADVVVEPGKTLADATVLVTGTSITSVAKTVPIPAGYQVIDCSGMTLYAGLIDAWSEVEVALDDATPGHWNSNVTPQRQASTVVRGEIDNAEKLRSQGIAVRVLAPEGGIVKGSSCVCLTGDASEGRTLLKSDVWQHLQLTVPRGGSRSRYPNSPMGAVALLRQTLLDASWYREAWEAYRATPELRRPETNVALDTLARSIDQSTFVIDAPNDRMAIRADDIAREFSLNMIVRGSGQEYRQLGEIASSNRAVLLPVDFPDPPNVKTADAARNVSLQTLMHWDLAPENPSRLVDAGVRICLTTDGLEDLSEFLKRVRKAVARGLSEEDALAAMTTTPAELLRMDSTIGRVAPGMLANLIVVDGNLFTDNAKILETWVAGERFIVAERDVDAVDQLAGKWNFDLRLPQRDPISLVLELESDDGKIKGVMKLAGREVPAGNVEETSSQQTSDERDSDEKSAEDATSKGNPVVADSTKLEDVVRERDRLTANLKLEEIDRALPSGTSQLTVVELIGEGETPELVARLKLPSGDEASIQLSFVSAEPEADSDRSEPESSDPKEEQSSTEAEPTSDSDAASLAKNEPGPDGTAGIAEAEPAVTPLIFPLGAYGLSEPVTEQPTVLFRGATVWTCEDVGVLEAVDILVREGRIAEIGPGLQTPSDCVVIDVQGKHITPGLIDCHSHMGTDGGVNESGQAVTSEVRIGDFIDNSDIQIYRQAAGGLTTSNILHGSANPIGGQNQVIKLRWGDTMDGLKMEEAPQGIKFALGENVKRTQTRYPNTRMGVEQLLRDQLLAAREYQAKWRRWRRGERDSLPPRTDLQLEALSEVQNGTRWIHCHSYRQDEIVATLDVLEEFGIRIGTLQHILEGYKVADRMAQHGAMGSSFSDWWAYKFEVFDAIPYNGALMHERGVVVSFNSDDRELARHLNTEAAKATKYGGVPEMEALKFVTLNPAKQLRIDQYVGSLAVGKHADLVVWSGRPLSTLTRCEQTWIDGRRYFDLDRDRQLRTRDTALRAELIQKVLAGNKNNPRSSRKEIAEENRWVRHDIYCAAHGNHEYDYTANLRNQGADE